MAIQKRTKRLLAVSGIVTIVPVVGAFIVAIYTGDGALDLAAVIALALVYISLACAVVSFALLFLLPRWYKLLSVFGILIQLSVAFLAYIVHGFNDIRW